MDNFTKIKIDDRIYCVRKLSPMEAIDYGLKVATVISPALSGLVEITRESGDQSKALDGLSGALKGGEAGAILKEALRQCFTPENENLADEVTFNRWFQKYPGDMFVLASRAVWDLVKDFLPPMLITRAGEISSNLTAKAL